MCIMLTQQEPSATRLMNIPVQLSNGTKCKLLIYTNDLEAPKNALMVVPIPNPTNTFDNFGFIDISSKENKAFRKSLVDSCQQFTATPQMKDTFGTHLVTQLFTQNLNLSVKSTIFQTIVA